MTSAHGHLSLRDYGPSHGSHSHAHFQVLVGLQGALDLEVEGRGHRIGAGEGLVVAPGERHDFESARGSRCLVLDTTDAMWARCATAPMNMPQVSALAGYLAQAVQRGQPLARLHGPALLLEAWSPPPAAAQRPRRRIDWQALAVWVQARLDQPLAVEDLARRVFLSASQFTLRCHEAHGMSPHAWLRLQRLARARQLRDTGLPVADVARRTGYRSPSALTAALRRQGWNR
jgi:AraC-like DNA-binding protein